MHECVRACVHACVLAHICVKGEDGERVDNGWLGG